MYDRIPTLIIEGSGLMRATSSGPGIPRLMFKALMALMVATAWGALGYGLVFSRPDVEAWDDLEAGGRFALNFTVYLPYLVLSLPLAAVTIVSLFPRPDRMFPLAAAMGLTGVFAVWLLANGSLLVAEPELATYALGGLGLAAAAVVPLLSAHEVKAHPSG